MHHTTSQHTTGEAADPAGPVVAPEDLLAAGDRRARARTLAQRAEARQRTRRRILPAALVGASVLALAGAADRFVAGTVPASTAAAAPPAPASAPVPPVGVSAAALNQISRTLAADQKAIAALAQAQAALSRSAGGGGGGDGGGGGGGALPAVSLPSLPALPSASSLSVPAAAPATHATTGASVVVP